jgi:short-subunit dehydrogenase
MQTILDSKSTDQSPMSAASKVILVTGATSGIGQATSLLLASQGHHVVAVGRRKERLDELVVEAKKLSGEIWPIAADVRDAKAMEQAGRATYDRYKRLDVLVAGAGLGHRGLMVEADWDDLEMVLRTNIDGVIHSIRACVPYMQASSGGHIITISSVLGPVPAGGAAVYAASKAAVDSLARALRVELAPDNIWVTNFIVGQTHTEFGAKRLGRAGKVASKWPTMTPERVARKIAWAMHRRKRTVILRWLDRGFVVAGTFLPRILDRILARIYLKR